MENVIFFNEDVRRLEVNVVELNKLERYLKEHNYKYERTDMIMGIPVDLFPEAHFINVFDENGDFSWKVWISSDEKGKLSAEGKGLCEPPYVYFEDSNEFDFTAAHDTSAKFIIDILMKKEIKSKETKKLEE